LVAARLAVLVCIVGVACEFLEGRARRWRRPRRKRFPAAHDERRKFGQQQQDWLKTISPIQPHDAGQRDSGERSAKLLLSELRRSSMRSRESFTSRTRQRRALLKELASYADDAYENASRAATKWVKDS